MGRPCYQPQIVFVSSITLVDVSADDKPDNQRARLLKIQFYLLLSKSVNLLVGIMLTGHLVLHCVRCRLYRALRVRLWEPRWPVDKIASHLRYEEDQLNARKQPSVIITRTTSAVSACHLCVSLVLTLEWVFQRYSSGPDSIQHFPCIVDMTVTCDRASHQFVKPSNQLRRSTNR